MFDFYLANGSFHAIWSTLWQVNLWLGIEISHISQSGMKHGLSGIHICRIIQKKQGFYFSQGTVTCSLFKEPQFSKSAVEADPAAHIVLNLLRLYTRHRLQVNVKVPVSQS